MQPDTTVVKDLKNLGTEYAYWLNKVGIYTLADLKKEPITEIIKHLEQVGFKPGDNLSYVLKGALIDKDWEDVAREK